MAGLIAQERLQGFERLLFRATRGNMFLRTAPVGPVQDPVLGEKVDKSVFIVFSSGERARVKVTKARPQPPCFVPAPPARQPSSCGTRPQVVRATPDANLGACAVQICEAFGANRYPLPEEAARQRQASAEVDQRLLELTATINAGDAHRQNVLRVLATSERVFVLIEAL